MAGKKQLGTPKKQLDTNKLLEFFDDYIEECEKGVRNETRITEKADKLLKKDVTILAPKAPTIEGYLRYLRITHNIIIPKSTFYYWKNDDNKFHDLHEIINNDISAILTEMALAGLITPSVAIFTLTNLGHENPYYQKKTVNIDTEQSKPVFNFVPRGTLPEHELVEVEVENTQIVEI